MFLNLIEMIMIRIMFDHRLLSSLSIVLEIVELMGLIVNSILKRNVGGILLFNSNTYESIFIEYGLETVVFLSDSLTLFSLDL